MFRVDVPHCAIPTRAENVLSWCSSNVNMQANQVGKRFCFSSRGGLGLSSAFLTCSPVTPVLLIHEPHCAANFSACKWLHISLGIRTKLNMADKALHGLAAVSLSRLLRPLCLAFALPEHWY